MLVVGCSVQFVVCVCWLVSVASCARAAFVCAIVCLVVRWYQCFISSSSCVGVVWLRVVW